MSFVWSSKIANAEVKMESDVPVLHFEGTAFDDSVNKNKWQIPKEEWADIITQIKSGRVRIKKDHSKSVDSISGRALDAWVGMDETTKLDAVKFNAETIDKELQVKILKGYLDTVSIAGDAKSIECSVCGKSTIPFKTCKHNGHEIIHGLKVKEFSFVDDPAYDNATIKPISFSACVNCYLDDRDNIQASLARNDMVSVEATLSKYPEDYRREVRAFIDSALHSNSGTGLTSQLNTLATAQTSSQITSVAEIAATRPEGRQVAAADSDKQVNFMSQVKPPVDSTNGKNETTLSPAGSGAVVVLGEAMAKFEERFKKLEEAFTARQKKEEDEARRKKEEEDEAKKKQEDDEARKKMEQTVTSKMDEVISKLESLMKQDAFTRDTPTDKSLGPAPGPGAQPHPTGPLQPSSYSAPSIPPYTAPDQKVGTTAVPAGLGKSEGIDPTFSKTTKSDETKKAYEAGAKVDTSGDDPNGKTIEGRAQTAGDWRAEIKAFADKRMGWG